MRILTVLRSGGEFKPEHVDRLRKQITRSVPLVDFQCLTDLPGIRGGIELRHNWPGWWSKLELFRIPGPCLYLDLDTTVRGSLRPFLEHCRNHDFIAARDFIPGRSGRLMNSSLMGWRGDLSRIYQAFASDPARVMAEFTTPEKWGDQSFIEQFTAGRKYWQELEPAAVVSYKLHCRLGVPHDARIICHHGKPRPWEIEQNARL